MRIFTINLRSAPWISSKTNNKKTKTSSPPCAVEADGRDLVAPRVDGADAMPRTGLDDGGKVALLANRRRVERQMRNVAREVAHHAAAPMCPPVIPDVEAKP